jgi:hypothetical protein
MNINQTQGLLRSLGGWRLVSISNPFDDRTLLTIESTRTSQRYSHYFSETEKKPLRTEITKWVHSFAGPRDKLFNAREKLRVASESS